MLYFTAFGGMIFQPLETFCVYPVILSKTLPFVIYRFVTQTLCLRFPENS